jgi:pyruvate/2-oxoglutarate dehydrogenase complex dihydrolipoamide dehydrogenase (E3) component
VKEANKIIVLGGGYIGVEVADEILKVKGKDVKIVEKLDTLFSMTMDSEFGLRAQEEIEKAGGEVILGESVIKIVGDKKVKSVVLSDKRIIDADLVLVAVGYKPNYNLARTFQLAYNENQGILVDEYLRSSEREIFAIGDCAAKFDFFTGEFSNIMLASTAMAEGRLVGSNLFTIKVIRKYIGVLGSFSTKIGNTTFGASGLTENKAKLMNLEYTVGNGISIDRHPGKLPGASKVHVKLIFARYSHTLVGAQVHGGDSVGEMINMLSVMILNKMTDMDIDNLQIGTHPLLTASPIAYPVLTATTDAILKWYVNQTN